MKSAPELQLEDRRQQLHARHLERRPGDDGSLQQSLTRILKTTVVDHIGLKNNNYGLPGRG
jgi:hypothetical protein